MRSSLLSNRLRLVVLLSLVCLWHGAPSRLAAQTADKPSSDKRSSNSSGTAAASLSPPAGASPNETLQLQMAETQAKLDQLAGNTEIDATLKERLTATYKSTLEAFKSIAADTDLIAKYAKSATLAPDRLAEARNKIKSPAEAFKIPEDADRLTIEELRQRRGESDTALQTARKDLQSLEQTLRERESRRAQLPMLLSEARKTLAELEAAPLPEVEDDPQGTLAAARQVERDVKLQSLAKSIDALTQEQTTIDAESELLPAQLELLKRDVQQLEAPFRFWTEKLGTQKQYQIENDIAQHVAALEADDIEPNRSLVNRMQADWINIIREQSQLERKLVRERARNDELNDLYTKTKQEIDDDLSAGRGLRSGLGLKLQLARGRIPSTASLREESQAIDKLIDWARTIQSTLELTLEDVREDGTNRLILSTESPLPMRGGVIDSNELSLIRRMKTDVDQHLNLLLDIKGEQEDRRKHVNDLRSLIEKHIVWIRNTGVFSLNDISIAWEWFRWIVKPEHLKAVGSAIIAGLMQRFDLIVFFIVGAVSIWLIGSRLRRRLVHEGDQLLEMTTSVDSPQNLKPTWMALLITLVLALPPVVTLVVLGYAILEVAGKDSYLLAVGSGFLFTAQALFPMEALRQMLRPGGLAIKHFGYRADVVMPTRTSLRFLLDLGVPLLLLWRICNDSGRSQMDASLGRLIFFGGMFALSSMLWHSLHPTRGLFADYIQENSQGWLARLKHLWHPLIAMMPVLLAVITMLGYSYTARLLAGNLYWTLWLGIGVLVIGGLLRLWFIAYRKRVSQRLKMERSVEELRLEGSSVEVSADPTNVDVMHEQSLRLIRVLMFLIATAGLAWIWYPVLPAVGFLDSVPLWNTTSSDGSRIPVTLRNLIIFLPIVVLSVIAVRNLPGLIEGLLLERLPLDRPARYAITTLAKYVIAIVGILISAQTLGLRWEGLQWLVAAVGVGLGFGLQEIFANFISGLILLFEQPIRVGDTVTIDGTSGTVSRIRLRATVVTNFDRQELIIPNKDLITGRLINWTLTDSTNRLTLNFGIAYGSDTRKACQILEQICAQHENLLVDPKPVVTFEGFGDSTLNIVVRCFLNSLDQRLETLHQLNTTINERFAAEGIEIAIPQRGLHIRSMTPEVAKLLNREGTPGVG